MKIFKVTSLFIIFFIAALFIFDQHAKDREALYQVSILTGLMAGDYEGKVTLHEIRKHGDFGIGTFDQLDGEGTQLDGVFYQFTSDGIIRRPAGGLKSPFAMATFFNADKKFPITQEYNYQSLQEFIDGYLPTKNIPYAIKIEGRFSYIKTRGVPAQNKPYPPLSEVVKNQRIFEFGNIEGTMVGFRMPDYTQGVNVPGYHMHFLSYDKTKGGHVLEFTIADGKVSIDDIKSLAISLPPSQDFYRLGLSSTPTDVSAVEKGK